MEEFKRNLRPSSEAERRMKELRAAEKIVQVVRELPESFAESEDLMPRLQDLCDEPSYNGVTNVLKRGAELGLFAFGTARALEHPDPLRCRITSITLPDKIEE